MICAGFAERHGDDCTPVQIVRRLAAAGLVERCDGLIGGASTTATVPGECTGCHVEYSIDVRLPAPDCPDCGDPVLRQDDFDSVPVRRPPAGFNSPRIRS